MAEPTNYTWEEREKILQRTFPPENMSISDLAEEIGVTTTTYIHGARKSTVVNPIHHMITKKFNTGHRKINFISLWKSMPSMKPDWLLTVDKKGSM